MPSTVWDEASQSFQEIDARDLIPPDEGSLKQIYGRIGNFKTYYATVKAFELLEAGQVVKTNWHIDWKGYDERKIWWMKKLGQLHLKKSFLEFPKENYQYFSILPEWAQDHRYPNFLEWFAHQTDCHIFIDEGHIAFDSYQLTKMSIEDRVKVLSTRHYNRSCWIISQRPSAIHVTYRANVNQFFKCEDLGGGFFGRSYRVTEFQDTTGDGVPDETREELYDEETHEVIGWKYKFAVSDETRSVDKKMYLKYDSKYLRAGMSPSQKNAVKLWRRNGKEWELVTQTYEAPENKEARILSYPEPVVVEARNEEDDVF